MDTLEDGTVVVHNPEPGVWTEEEAWRIEEELRIGRATGEGPEVFTQILALTVDGLGRVYVGDAQTGEVRVFSRDGRHVRTFGGKGGGPGEIDSPVGIEPDGQGRIWVVDLGNNRHSVFDTAGGFVASGVRKGGVTTALPWRAGFTEDGLFWDLSGSRFDPEAPIRLVGLDSAFREVAEHPLRLGGHDSPVQRRWRLDPGGFVWLGPPKQFRIAKRELGGDTVRILERDVEPRELSEGERQERLGAMRSRIAQMPDGSPADASLEDVATHADVHEGFSVDGAGRLWVRAPEGRVNRRRPYLVFDAEGRYLGPVTWTSSPASQPPTPVFDGDELWYVVEDDMDVQRVVRGRIVRPGEGE
jgi:hypothetical protein